MDSEVATRADFSGIRYAQCWEDADILLEALDIQPGQTCFSVASGGDNTLAMLSRGPGRVIAVDLSPAQLACLELRVAAYRELDHQEMRELLGSLPSMRREQLYRRCRAILSPLARSFWDAHSTEIAGGVGDAGKIERYLALFRTRILPLIHPRERVARLLQGGTREQREKIYDEEWDTWRWRLLFRTFFSRQVMGFLGRDPSFFRYAEGSVSGRIFERTRYAMTEMDPAQNPYLQWILTGRHVTALPFSLRLENFDSIRANLDRLEWYRCSVEDFLDMIGEGEIDRYNLSDIFEYMSPDSYHRLLERLARSCRKGARLAYWNTLVERRRPDHMADRLRSLTGLAQQLYRQDKAFFYSAFIVEEIV